MGFEIKTKDLLSRIGKLKTKSGTIETPFLFPVINPAVQPIPPQKIRDDLGFEALITNAYILKTRYHEKPIELGVHNFLDFKGVVMTDSGAYQLLVYGKIPILPEEIVSYQERIDTDIATILDWPTGWKVSRTHAEDTVKRTLQNAERLFKLKTRDDILWVGPIQGGNYLELIAKSSTEMKNLPFDVYALGSPTQVLESYRFDVLINMIMAAKMNLPIETPFHLFGAGHPFMFSLAVALGCDLFDSAAYALYAREGRYMTVSGTYRLSRLNYFPCECPKCMKTSPKEVREMNQHETTIFLAEHNLYVCQSELRTIKQAITEGTLWEHLEIRAHSHPALLTAVKQLRNYRNFIEKYDPSVKASGLFFFNSLGLNRPEIVKYRKRLNERYSPPVKAIVLFLLPQSAVKPLHKSKEYKKCAKLLQNELGEQSDQVHLCFYSAPFGVIPLELDEIYPLSQYQTVFPLDKETIEDVALQMAEYVTCRNYQALFLFYDSEKWNETIIEFCQKACFKKNMGFKCFPLTAVEDVSMFIELKRLLLESRAEMTSSS